MICIIITINNKKKTQTQDYFSEEEDAFKSWLSKVADKRQSRCRLYMKDFELSSMGKKALLSHAARKKPRERDITIKTFFKTANQNKLLTKIQNLNQLKIKMVIAQIFLHM